MPRMCTCAYADRPARYSSPISHVQEHVDRTVRCCRRHRCTDSIPPPELIADRVYGTVTWPQRTDKSGAFVRKYCPELRDMPDRVSCITPWLTECPSSFTLSFSKLKLILGPHRPVHVRALKGPARRTGASQVHHRSGLSCADARRRTPESSVLGQDEGGVRRTPDRCKSLRPCLDRCR
jgi:hypothetical protein